MTLPLERQTHDGKYLDLENIMMILFLIENSDVNAYLRIQPGALHGIFVLAGLMQSVGKFVFLVCIMCYLLA